MRGLPSFKDNRSLFWWFQIPGWIVFSFIFFPLFSSGYLQSLKAFLTIVLTITLGFSTTCVMRIYFRKVYANRFTPFTLVLHILSVSILFATAWVVVDYTLSAAIWGITKDHVILVEALQTIATNTGILFGWSLLYFALKIWIEWTHEKQRAEAALEMARNAQLLMLRYQLNPHFLFNTLNLVNVLIDKDGQAAKNMVVELVDFLRYSLDNRDVVFVQLSEELEAMEHYFTIQKIRFEESLEIVLDVSDEAKPVPVLSFLIHPLIENAVKYGMQTSPTPLLLKISARVSDDMLHLSVWNSGWWVNERESDSGTGTGLENVRKRLVNAYRGIHKLEIVKLDDSVEVKISLPIEKDQG